MAAGGISVFTSIVNGVAGGAVVVGVAGVLRSAGGAMAPVDPVAPVEPMGAPSRPLGVLATGGGNVEASAGVPMESTPKVPSLLGGGIAPPKR